MKSKKIALIVLGVVVIVGTAGGFWGYKFYTHTQKVKYQQQEKEVQQQQKKEIQQQQKKEIQQTNQVKNEKLDEAFKQKLQSLITKYMKGKVSLPQELNEVLSKIDTTKLDKTELEDLSNLQSAIKDWNELNRLAGVPGGITPKLVNECKAYLKRPNLNLMYSTGLVTKVDTRQQFSVLRGVISEGALSSNSTSEDNSNSTFSSQSSNNDEISLVTKNIIYNGKNLNAGQVRDMISKATGAKVTYMPESERTRLYNLYSNNPQSTSTLPEGKYKNAELVSVGGASDEQDNLTPLASPNVYIDGTFAYTFTATPAEQAFEGGRGWMVGLIGVNGELFTNDDIHNAVNNGTYYLPYSEVKELQNGADTNNSSPNKWVQITPSLTKVLFGSNQNYLDQSGICYGIVGPKGSPTSIASGEKIE